MDRFRQHSSATASFDAVRLRTLLLIAGLTAGCNFDRADTLNSMNTCVVDSDCTSKHCQAGLCVTLRTPNALSITLEITPKRMPDGSQPFPMVTDSFTLGSKPNFALHRPVPVVVRVVEGSKPIDAQVTFRPKLDSGFVAKSTQVSTAQTSTAASKPADASVSLLEDMLYEALVQPVDPTRAPHTVEFRVYDDALFEVDYASIMWRERKYSLRKVPEGAFLLRARAKSTGQIISSSAMVSTGVVTLKLPADEIPYELELSPIGKTQATASVYSGCDEPTTLLPTLTLDVTQLEAETKAEAAIAVDLPTLPKPISYSGTINLCANQDPPPDSLPMTLKSAAVSFTASNKLVRGSFETVTTAGYDRTAKQFNFCSWILPGDYIIKITPPTNINCEIFAERRLLTPNDGELIGDAELAMRTPATLSATILTPDGSPMANASVDLVALGISGVTLAEDDQTVPVYNRSRQGTSMADGTFKVPADVGTYDVIVKPPAQSDFAWQVIYDVDVASRTPRFTTRVMLASPTVVNGTLRYASGMMNDQLTLAAAEVHAFTVVDEGTKNQRSVEIARTQADADGNVTLLLSSMLVHNSWSP